MIIELTAFDGRLSNWIDEPAADWKSKSLVYSVLEKPLSALVTADLYSMPGIHTAVFVNTGHKRAVTAYELADRKLKPSPENALTPGDLEIGYYFKAGPATYRLPIFELNPRTMISQEARNLLKHLYVDLFAEVHVEPYSEYSQQFAEPLLAKLEKLNQLLHFSEELQIPAEEYFSEELQIPAAEVKDDPKEQMQLYIQKQDEKDLTMNLGVVKSVKLILDGVKQQSMYKPIDQQTQDYMHKAMEFVDKQVKENDQKILKALAKKETS